MLSYDKYIISLLHAVMHMIKVSPKWISYNQLMQEVYDKS